ncbi:flotillin domain-containing protein [Escherichia coli]
MLSDGHNQLGNSNWPCCRRCLRVNREIRSAMKSIDGIKIIQVDGLNRGGAAGDASTGSVSGGNLAEQALSAALSYRTQAPLIDSVRRPNWRFQAAHWRH